jgi:hypothetical protein
MGATGVSLQQAKVHRVSPYQMLYATAPTLPSSARRTLTHPVDMDGAQAAADSINKRAGLLKRMCVMAGDNLRIAQQRDTLRYATLRGGAYRPTLRKFEPGDFVYLRKASDHNALLPNMKQSIYRVVLQKAGGAISLQGHCGRIVSTHVVNCAPCHLPNIDDSINVRLAQSDKDQPCTTTTAVV